MSTTARMRRVGLALPMTMLGLMAACEGSELHRPFTNDGGTTTSPDSDTIEPSGALDFELVTKDGKVGLGVSTIALAPTDEVDAYSGTAGLQFDVSIITHGITNGTAVQLYVDDVALTPGVVSADDALDGTAGFLAVTIPYAAGGVPVRVQTTNLAGDTVTEEKTVTIEVSPCVITASFVDTNAACTNAVVQGNRAGVPVRVTRTSGLCDSVIVTWQLDSTSSIAGVVPEQAFDTDGIADVFVDLGSASDTFVGDLSVDARAAHPLDHAADGTAHLETRLDAVEPELQWVMPDPAVATVLGPADDVDVDSDGIQVAFVVHVDEASQVALTIGGVVLQTEDVSAAGDFTFEPQTVSGDVDVTITATDLCGNVDELTASFIVIDTTGIVLASPAEGATLLAVDDLDTSNSTFDSTFRVVAPAATVGATATVLCKPVTQDETVPFEVVGALLIDAVSADSGYSVPVSIAATHPDVWTCIARLDIPAVESAARTFTLAFPGPTLTLVAPHSNECFTTKTIAVSGTATGLDGRTIIYELDNGDSGDFGAVVASGSGESTFAGTVTLPASAPDGNFTLSVDGADQYGNVVSDTEGPVQVLFGLDTVDPTLAITAPASATIGPTGDTNALLAGFQTTVQATMSDVHTFGGRACLRVNGGAETCLDLSGSAVSFTNVTLAPGTNTLTLNGTDACANAAPEVTKVVELMVQNPLFIVTPTDGATLLAVNDLKPATGRVYDTNFTVSATALVLGATLSIDCHSDIDPTFVTVGTTLVGVINANQHYDVPVTLDIDALGNDLVCRARADLPGPSLSSEIDVRVGLPRPTLAITAPATDTCQTSHAFTVSGTSENLIARVVTLSGASGTATVAAGGNWSVAATVATDGLVAIGASATDPFGNVAAATPVTVLVDATAPVLALTGPSSPIDPNVSADADPVAPGYQTTLQATFTDTNTIAGKACVAIGSAAPQCIALTGSSAVSFPVTLQPGDNTVTLSGNDACGNAATPVTSTLTVLEVGDLTVTIINPPADLTTAATTQTFVVQVSDDAGALAGATVTLTASGSDAGVSAVDNLDGSYTFSGVTLPLGQATAFIASATSGARSGMSTARTITQKNATPTVIITSPADGAVLNLVSTACDAGTTACVTDITATTANTEDGSAAHLTVDCGALAIADGVVTGNAVTFADVSLPSGFDCTITVQVTDAIGQSASDTNSVTIDRVAPVVNITAPPDTLTTSDDKDAATPGVQSALMAEVSGVEAGQLVTATLRWVAAGIPQTRTLSATIDTDTDDDAIAVVTFEDVPGSGLVSYADAFVTVTVSVSDVAGNPGSDVQGVAVNVTTGVRIISPTDTADVCGAGCAVGVCNAGACFRTWGTNDSRQLVAAVTGIGTTTNNVRVCSDLPALASQTGAVQCTSAPSVTGPYYQVLLASTNGGNTVLDVSSVLPAGFQRVIVEALPVTGGTWVSSKTTTVVAERERELLVDLTVPVVTNLTSPSDTEAPTGFLDIAEQAASPRMYDISFSASEAARAEVHVNSAIVATQDVPVGVSTIRVTLPEGANQIWVVLTDIAANRSPATPGQGALTYSVTVDTVRPTLAFSRPNKAILTGADSLDVVLTSDAEGQTVTLLDSGTQLATGVVAGGTVTFTGVLTQGTHTLTATVADSAGNTKSAETTPTTILVDTDPPTVAITAPSDNDILTDGDDADAASGFQVNVTFTTGNGAATWTLYTQSGCDALGGGCAPRVQVATGAVTNPGGAEPSQLVTLNLTDSLSFHKVIVEVADDGGNVASDTSDFSVLITTCQLTFTDLPAGGWYNIANACAGGVPCASATVPVTIDQVGSCSATTRIALLNNGAEVASSSTPSDPQTFMLTINDGDHLVLEAKVFDGATEIGSTGERVRDADFKAPAVTFVPRVVNGFTTPAEGASLTYNTLIDLSATTPGMQLHASVDVVDAHAEGGQITSITATGAATVNLTPSNINVPYTLPAGTTVSTNLLDLTLADLQTHTVVVTATDRAGNSDTATFTAKVDVTAPDEVPITQLIIQARRPRTLPLTFTHVGDNGMTGGPVARYEVRYSPSPITAANFSAACNAVVPELLGSGAAPVPQAPGTVQQKDYGAPDVRPYTDPCKLAIEFQQTGLDDEIWMYWAMRAQDAAGNWSPITTQAVRGVKYKDMWLKLNRVRVDNTSGVFGTADQGNFLTLRGVVLGDIDGGGRRDVAFGSSNSNGFCVVRGEALSNPDFVLSAASSANHACLLSAQVTALFPGATSTGHQIERLGDVNGDGIEDFGVSGRTANLAVGYVAIYFGRSGSLPDLTAPNIRISGMASASTPTSAYNSWCATGDFDGLATGGVFTSDFAVGQSTGNTNYLIVFPGKTSWTTATNLSIDVTQPQQVIDNGGLTINWTGTTTTPSFASRCTRLGDILPTPGGGPATSDIAISQIGSADGRVIVVPGRSWTAGQTETITEANAPPSAEDARVVRLRQDSAQIKTGFGSHFSGEFDLTNDAIIDVLVSQPNRSPGVTTGGTNSPPGDGKAVYIFDGAKIRAAVGGDLRLQTTATTPKIGDTWVADNGYIIAAQNLNSQFRGLRAMGDFNNSITNAPTVDICYGNVAGTMVELRMNHSGGPQNLHHGTFPVVDGFFEDIYTAGGNTIGFWVESAVDLTGDGLVDIITGGSHGELIIAR